MVTVHCTAQQRGVAIFYGGLPLIKSLSPTSYRVVVVHVEGNTLTLILSCLILFANNSKGKRLVHGT